MALSMTSFASEARTAALSLPKGKRMLGLDLGTKTIGMATSDFTGQFATPRETIKRAKFTLDAQYLLAFAEKEQIGLLVLGLPLNMDGTEGPRAQATRAFARNLSKMTAIQSCSGTSDCPPPPSPHHAGGGHVAGQTGRKRGQAGGRIHPAILAGCAPFTTRRLTHRLGRERPCQTPLPPLKPRL